MCTWLMEFCTLASAGSIQLIQHKPTEWTELQIVYLVSPLCGRTNVDVDQYQVRVNTRLVSCSRRQKEQNWTITDKDV